MKKVKLLVVALVTWQVVGTAVIPCGSNQKPDSHLGFCTQAVDITRSARFASPEDAKKWVKELKTFQPATIKVGEVDYFSEEGVQ